MRSPKIRNANYSSKINHADAQNTNTSTRLWFYYLITKIHHAFQNPGSVPADCLSNPRLWLALCEAVILEPDSTPTEQPSYNPLVLTYMNQPTNILPKTIITGNLRLLRDEHETNSSKSNFVAPSYTSKFTLLYILVTYQDCIF